jgi:sulfur relay protein TusB/DsrH
MLYTLNKPSLTNNALASLLRIAPAGTPILLYEDGVYAAAQGSASADRVKTAMKDHPFYALDADLEARAVKHILPDIKVIGYDGFVELVEQQEVVPWL